MSVFLLLEGTTYACLEHERIALLQLKPFFNHYDELVDWDKPKGSDCCRWKGIECNTTTRRLVGLTLNSTRDSSEGWYLNASLFLPFVGLKRLYLRGNAIAGCIENEGFEKLSSALGNLEILDLSVNLLNDSVILPLSEFSSLRYLSLAFNQLEGSSHSNGFRWFSRLLNLGTLDLSWNPLGNDIMFQLSSLSSLKNLSLRSIDLEGELLHIQGLNNLTNLRYLDLNSNSIESILNKDETQLRLANLERLDLKSRSVGSELECIKGMFPHCLGNLTSLRELDISNNQFSGNLSPLQTLTHLHTSLSKNRLQIPTSFVPLVNLPNLKFLYGDENNMVMEPSLHTSIPKFQLNVISVKVHNISRTQC
ncbi:hypothetical protein F3Y22_tig00110195pilonHSYRG00170 [Hibiscus syriacus]|uniref:Leucine-rich repeat-containing N-terminal plant-type domain-containing protein n=1 Tax=Hibiscus syriacus TaxID=106335 RepID=A0A6A3BC30_HIBSY|nr:hypothetical protein F3Y22_tig00110195pilonHSYRG00170 [Hibiscus syriacus]